MERAKKKSSKEVLEQKQMKRYFRSKKRSQNRNKSDNEPFSDDVAERDSKETLTERKENMKEASDKMHSFGSKYLVSTLSTKINSEQNIHELSEKVNKQVLVINSTNDSTESKANTMHIEEGDVKAKKQNIVMTNQKSRFKPKDIENDIKTSNTWVEEMNVINKKITIESGPMYEPEYEKKPITMFKENATNIYESPKKQENYKLMKDEFIHTTVTDKMITENNKSTMNHKATYEQLENIDNPLHRKLALQLSPKTGKEGMEETIGSTEKNCLRIVSNTNVDIEMSKDGVEQKDTMLSFDRSFGLDNKNVWLDKYLYSDAESGYYQQEAKKKHNQANLQDNKNEHCESIVVKEKIVDFKDEVNDKNLESSTKNVEKVLIVKDSIKSKPKVIYEIVEEISEITEITYKLVMTDSNDDYMQEQLKKFGTKNCEFEQYLSELGGYVNTLEDRVKILEDGENIPSNGSDEGLDKTISD